MVSSYSARLLKRMGIILITILIIMQHFRLIGYYHEYYALFVYNYSAHKRTVLLCCPDKLPIFLCLLLNGKGSGHRKLRLLWKRSRLEIRRFSGDTPGNRSIFHGANRSMCSYISSRYCFHRAYFFLLKIHHIVQS